MLETKPCLKETKYCKKSHSRAFVFPVSLHCLVKVLMNFLAASFLTRYLSALLFLYYSVQLCNVSSKNCLNLAKLRMIIKNSKN